MVMDGIVDDVGITKRRRTRVLGAPIDFNPDTPDRARESSAERPVRR
jgi:hypothetical protein